MFRHAPAGSYTVSPGREGIHLGQRHRLTHTHLLKNAPTGISSSSLLLYTHFGRQPKGFLLNAKVNIRHVHMGGFKARGIIIF